MYSMQIVIRMTSGFVVPLQERKLSVNCPQECLKEVPARAQRALLSVLAHDPRPSYQNDPERVYGMEFAGVNVRFRVEKDVLTVCEIQKTTVN